MTSQRDYANDNETATTADGDVISGHNETGSIYVPPGQVQEDEGFRHRNVESNNTQTQTQIQTRDSDSRRNNDSAINNDVFIFRNSSEEIIANFDQKMAKSEDKIERNYSNQTEKHRGPTSQAILSTMTLSTQGHSSSTPLSGKPESASTPSFETFTDQGYSRAEIDTKSAQKVTEVTDRRLIEVMQEQSKEYPSPVPAVPRRTSRRTAKYATTTKLVRTGRGHVTSRSEADDSRTRDVTGNVVVTKAGADFIYKNLWEEVDVKYEAQEEEDDDDDDAKRGSIERTGTSTDSWSRRPGGGGGDGGGLPSTLEVQGQLLAVEMEKARREEDAGV